MDRTLVTHLRPAHLRSTTAGAAALVVSLSAFVAGCSSDSPTQPLTAEQFAARNGVTLGADSGRSAGQPVDRAGAVPYDTTERRSPTAPETGTAPQDPNPNPDPRP